MRLREFVNSLAANPSKSFLVQWDAEILVIGRFPTLEILRQILFGVSVPATSYNPNLTAAKPFSERLQDAYLVGDPVDFGGASFSTTSGIHPDGTTPYGNGTGRGFVSERIDTLSDILIRYKYNSKKQ